MLSLNSPVLDSLDLSKSNLGAHSCESLRNYLSIPDSRLQCLCVQNNLLLDEGICSLSLGLLANSALMHLNIASCGLELASGLALARVLRINRGLRAVVLSHSLVSGRAFREISRALIVNRQVVSINATACGLGDEDAREIAHMLNSNTKLLQLILAQNKISQKGLGYLRDGVGRNRKSTLVHVGLSGNSRIKLKALEEIKGDLQMHFEVDISKEEEFWKTDEARRFKLIEYIRYKDLRIFGWIVLIENIQDY